MKTKRCVNRKNLPLMLQVILGAVGLVVLLLNPLFIQERMWTHMQRLNPQFRFEPADKGIIILSMVLICILPILTFISLVLTAITIPIISFGIYQLYTNFFAKPSRAPRQNLSASGINKFVDVMRCMLP